MSAKYEHIDKYAKDIGHMFQDLLHAEECRSFALNHTRVLKEIITLHNTGMKQEHRNKVEELIEAIEYNLTLNRDDLL